MNNGDGLQPYSVEIDGNGSTMKEFYEWLKYLTRYGSTTQVNGDDGQEYRSVDEGTAPEVKTAPFGTLAGTTFYGALGVWVTDYSLADFVLIDDDGDQQSPPNYQKVDCSHTSLSGCNILVTARLGSAVVKDQYTFDQVSSDVTHLHIVEDIDTNKTPLTGLVRIGDTQYPYTSFTGKIFTVTADPTGETDAADTYVPLLDVTADATTELSANLIYSGDFDVITSVRKYGFKPYDVNTSFGSAGLTFSPILTADPQAS